MELNNQKTEPEYNRQRNMTLARANRICSVTRIEETERGDGLNLLKLDYVQGPVGTWRNQQAETFAQHSK